jgi:cytoskeletal protein CcmA (bactofilin family)
LHGDIRAARVLVEEGATFNGKSHVNPGGAAVQKNATPTRKAPEPSKKRPS